MYATRLLDYIRGADVVAPVMKTSLSPAASVDLEILSEAELQSLTERPGTDATRPGIVRGNSMLDRFLNFARFRGDVSGEFR